MTHSELTLDLAYNPSPRCTEWLVENHMFATSLVVIDVGVQGGVGPRWDHFGTCIEVHGFDALEEAITPLQALARPAHHYYATALGNEDGERELFVAPEPTATSFYGQAPSRYEVSETVSRTAGTRLVPIRRLDTLLGEGVFERADFIKIDCEGFEPEILKGAQALLQAGVLALEIETNFSTSPVLPQSHFCAVCEQIVPHGLTLFDLGFDRIPRASFIARAQTIGIAEHVTVSRPATVNALFYRDSAARSADELLKRVAILEIYGMADTAYDVLLAGADLLSGDFPLQRAADLLIRTRTSPQVPPAPPTPASKRFFERFFWAKGKR
jgi:FkbM family methyltransferase